MKNYRYNGPASGVTLADGTEVLLWPGKDVSLPPDNDYVKTLVALQHLTPIDDQPVTPAKTRQADKTKDEVNSGS
ncbi:hypothetical protein HLB27_06480 [Dickeya dadantii]|uniref:hypothetical protein n=1 Tax=Dickeya dadantii TaxID=204038 RepID=UPI001495529C|nr:hypothetical protein [Dickeya dadantii]NPE59283.1 hypothetical protein [Dickeya dadantii]NPE70329.1 hypothetical protein [Dickeya dadantii]